MAEEQKNGLFEENGKLVYYKDGKKNHAGVIQIDGDIYYIDSDGYAVKGRHNVHGEMTNDILPHGTYTFGDDGKLIKDSYVAPKKIKRKRKRKKKMPTSKIIIATVIFVIVVPIITSAIVTLYNSDYGKAVTVGNSSTQKELVAPTFNEEVLLCSESAKKVYDGEMTVGQTSASGNPYKAFTFKYSLPNQDGALTLSEYSDLRSARKFVLPASSNSIEIDNLKTGTTYYFSLLADGASYPGSFTTAKSTRFINMPGVQNTRDIGGYTTLDGKTVKQGVLIRGTEIDGLVEPGYFLDKDSIEDIRQTFGFVCELDLRDATLFNGQYQSRLGKSVKHKFYNSPVYGSIFNVAIQPYLRQIFSDLANPSNYPMYIHCTYGADRTGTICFLLEGLLNLPENTLKTDYQMTGYSISSFASSQSFNSILGGLESFNGNTVQEKIKDFLTTSVGVSEAEINSIKRIFLN